MTRRTFDVSLQRLQDDVLVLGNLTGKALSQSVDILKARDTRSARGLIAEDKFIDEKRYAIEAEALMLIATQQPTAGDVRLLAAILFIANELERIADYAKGIARITIRLGNEPLLKPLVDIPRMAGQTVFMIEQSLQAFVNRDVEMAKTTIAKDAEIDALYEQIYRNLITKVLAQPEPKGIEQTNQILFSAHNLERAADRATNICERVIYCVTGEFIDTGWEEDEQPQPVGK